MVIAWWSHGRMSVMLLGVTSAVSQPAAAADLPHRLSSFVGREAERAEVAARLEETRLLTLTGVGGCGKTSLALEVARDVGDRFPDGVFWVELAPVSDPGLVAPVLARSVGVRPLPGETELDAVVVVLAGRRALVVLDNCEHLIERCAEVVEGVLLRCVATTVLATSRAPLQLPGEAEWRVPSLGLPRGAGVDGDVEAALDSDAVRLFADRARLVQANFSLDEDTVGPAVEICCRLDGIPLAIELAAGRMRLLSLEQIVHGLNDALGLVAGRAPTAPPRHRTLRASIEWSYDLLDPMQQRLFRRLGVCVGGFTLPLAKAVCIDAQLSGDELLDLLGALVEHSLVQVVNSDGSPRYRLLETVRQYALERLEQAAELGAARDRHCDAMLALAERQHEAVGGPRMAQALAAIDAEAANALAAIDHAVATSPEKAQRLCIALGSWFRHRGLLREGVRACEAALAAGPAAPALRARAMSTQAFLLGVQGDFDRSIALAKQAHDLAKDLGDDEAARHALLTAANFQMFTDPAAAAGSLERCLELGLRCQDDWVTTRSAMLLATVAWFQQDADRCEAYVVAHRERMEAVGDRQTLALALFAQGGSLYATLDHDRAAVLLREAVEVAQETGDPLAEGTLRMVLGRIQIAAGEPRAALEDVRDVRERLRAVGQFYYLAWAALTEGIAHAACGDLQTARVMLEPIVAGTLGGARNAIVWAQADLAEVLRLAGDEEASRAQATAALAAAQAIGNPWYAAKACMTLGWLSARRGEWRQAERLHNEALAGIAERGLRLELPSALEALAQDAAGMRGYEEAARLLGAADRCRRERGPVPWPAHHAEVQALMRELRDAMAEEQFERAFAEGEVLTDDEALAWARRGWGPRRRPAAGWESLTPAELDVVRHAAAGLTNPEIAEKLFIARATVKAHLAHIYAKLGVGNRTELAALAAEHLRE